MKNKTVSVECLFLLAKGKFQKFLGIGIDFSLTMDGIKCAFDIQPLDFDDFQLARSQFVADTIDGE